ncbi:MAG TPA: SGNH/GDSL hydrolase family protein [Steroidobacteraceae bacterium]|nr:SGNH/GDSL hydrolase family protein [Steroidobacteraceae bacterium]
MTRPRAALWPYVPLAPVLLWQGFLVRRRALRLPPATGREGRCGTGEPAYRIVGLGDSIIAGIGVSRHADSLVGRTAACMHESTGETIGWQARGFSGLRLSDVVERLLPGTPAADVYLISAGVNDAVAGTSTTAFACSLETLTAGLRAIAADAKIIFAGIPPMGTFPALSWPLSGYLDCRGRALQAAAQSVADRTCHLACYQFPDELDAGAFAPDGFHPGAQGCDVWAREIVALRRGRAK